MIDSLLQLFTSDFVVYALIAGISLSIIAGPLGSLIVWRRMSYFGDTLAHSALLGIAMGLITNSDPQLSIILSSVIFAIVLTLMDRKKSISTDNLLGIMAHSTLALGMVVLALSGSIRVNLEAYLFGALLTITSNDLLWIIGIVIVVAAALIVYWNDFLAITVHAELAEIDGTAVNRLNLILIMLIALTIAIAMKIVGVLLITSLLIIPPAAARRFSNSPEKMAFTASGIGVASIVLGLGFAFFLDVPVGPAIVVVATSIFLLTSFYPAGQKS